jgi:hypothetical protein
MALEMRYYGSPVHVSQAPACQKGASGNANVKANPNQYIEPDAHRASNPGPDSAPAGVREVRESCSVSRGQLINANLKIAAEYCP